MLTWLDRYVAEAARVSREALRTVDRSLLSHEAAVDPLLLAGFFGSQVVQEAVAITRGKVAEGASDAEAVNALPSPFVALTHATFLFVAPWLKRHGGLALQIAPELHADLRAAKAPASLDIADLVDRHRFIYLDFPGPPPRGEDLVLRAIFIRREDRTGPVFRVACAVLEGVGGTTAVVWNLGHPEAPATVTMYGAWTERSDEVRAELDDLAQLALIYYATHADLGTREALPTITPKRLAALASDKKRAAKLKAASLFSVIRLMSPPGRFGRPESSRAGDGYRLNHRVPVRGHFKLQPYGPGGQLRKLIWVEPHERGPKDAPQKARMIALD